LFSLWPDMKKPIASFIDHTLLKSSCSFADIEKLCKEAIEYKFAAVCIPPFAVKFAARQLSDKTVKTATVIGFPMGYSGVESKKSECIEAIEGGADELDIVINLMALKNGDWSYLESEIKELTAIGHQHEKVLKVIVESGILTKEELIHCCSLYGKERIDFLKTSTGYSEKGASVSDVLTMRKHLPPEIQIKASGGIRHYTFAEELIDAGATRLGCSAGIQILEEEKNFSIA
jgi:deoxyribose-phosphate aldolase